MVSYNFKDLQFCEDFDKLSTDSPEYVDYVGMRKGMAGSECSECPPSLVNKCKCYDQVEKGTDTGTINEVFCAQEIDGVRFACPEKCCGASGCPEPRRTQPPEDTTTESGEPSGSVSGGPTTPKLALAWWKILLIALGSLAFVGILVFLVFFRKKQA